MAFVKVTNGKITTSVSMGAFNNYYKKLGFDIVDGEEVKAVATKEPVSVVDIPDVEEETVESSTEETTEEVADDTDDTFVEELLEKPVSTWSTDEMKRFVTIKGIDTSDAKKASEVRGIIKNYLNEQEKNK